MIFIILFFDIFLPEMLKLFCYSLEEKTPSNNSLTEELAISDAANHISNNVTVLAYLLHHTFAILSVSYKFTCLTIKEVLLLYAGMLSLIKQFKPNHISKTSSYIRGLRFQ